VPLGVCLADGTLLAANDALVELIGRRPEELSAKGWLAVLYPHEGDLASVLGTIASIAETGGALHERRQVVRGDGMPRLFDFGARGFRLEDERRAVIVTVADRTEQWMPIGAAAGARMDDAPEVLSRFEVRTGRVLYVSPGIERITGLTPAEIYKQPELLVNSVQPEFRARFAATLAEVARGDARGMVVGVQRLDGTSMLVHQSFYPVRDGRGRVIVIEGLARDITQVRAMERELQKTIEELRKRNEELASVDRLKSQLLANVSHELRTPLVSIKGYNELILRGSLGPLTPRQRRGLEIAGANTERLVELIETLLDFARREEGRLTLHRARFDLRQAVRDAIGQTAQRMAARGMQLGVELGGEPLEVDGDAPRLGQVFRALLSNAEKFCGGVGGTVQVRAQVEGGQALVQVIDNGIGVPEEARDKIFERFYQVDASPTRAHGGAGLGLALAKEIMVLHGGEIAVSSAEGGGSTFQVRLPLASRRPIAGQAGEQRVLLVATAGDRAVELRAALKGALEGAGYALIVTDGAGDVVRRARRHRPDGVVLALPAREVGDVLDDMRRDGETGGIPVVAVVDAPDEAARTALVPRADLVLALTQIAQIQPAIARLLDEEGPHPAGRAPRVVIVDDEPENLDFTRLVLEREGFEVACVDSGEAALGRIDERCYLVILDVAMAGLDGIEVCRRIKGRSETRGVPVLVVTAMTGDEVRRGSLAAGAEGFLVKHFGVSEFLRQVRLHLRAPSQGKTAENA
jgi:PAS domain S-box-containing protein